MKKFNKIWLIVGLVLSLGLIIGGIALIIKGAQVPDISEINQGSSDITDFILGGFLIFAGFGVGVATIYLGIGHRIHTAIKEKGGLGNMIGQTVKDINDAQVDHCPYCGSKIELGESKCSNCGANVK